jgi:hypothetical protein
VTLDQILEKPRQKIRYLYDFGDSWEHDLLLEKVLRVPDDLPDGLTHPRCLDGARACPPEDCGGIPGYEMILAALADPEDPEGEELREIFDGYDPEEFDLPAINERLKRMR